MRRTRVHGRGGNDNERTGENEQFVRTTVAATKQAKDQMVRIILIRNEREKRPRQAIPDQNGQAEMISVEIMYSQVRDEKRLI